MTPKKDFDSFIYLFISLSGTFVLVCRFCRAHRNSWRASEKKGTYVRVSFPLLGKAPEDEVSKPTEDGIIIIQVLMYTENSLFIVSSISLMEVLSFWWHWPIKRHGRGSRSRAVDAWRHTYDAFV